LDAEGLFRLSAQSSDVTELKQRLDNGENVNFSKVLDCHAVSGLIKMFLRELPEPLLTFTQYTSFVLAADIGKLRQILAEIPPENYKFLEQFIPFLQQVAEHSAQNRMTISNLAVVFAPGLIRAEVDTAELVMQASAVNTNVELLFKEYQKIFAK